MRDRSLHRWAPLRDSLAPSLRLRRPSRLTDQPDHALVGVVNVPETQTSPWTAITRRMLLALTLLFVAAGIVYLERADYRDAQGGEMSFLDCLYYATVSLSTTGYGDIVPVSPTARLINTVVITPLRLIFLILLVGTTLAVLTERSRQAFKIQRWRSTVRDHTVVVGYGTKGRSAVDAMIGDGVAPSEIVVVDTHPTALEYARSHGLVTVHGSASQSDVLRLAGTPLASAVVVAVNRDDTAVLVTLTARELAPKAKIVVAVRENENTHLLRQSGADSVVVSSETAGRLLGIATANPRVVDMVEDLLTPEAGFAIAERSVTAAEVGDSPRALTDIVLAVVRAGELIRVGELPTDELTAGDTLLYIRRVAKTS